MERKMELERICFNRSFLKIFSFSLVVLVLGSLSMIPLSFAKDLYPADKITIVVPYRAGGGFDLYARCVAPFLEKYLKEVSPDPKEVGVMVRNESASAGRKGYDMIFNAKPDGYTLGIMEPLGVQESAIETPEYDFSKLTFLIMGRNQYRMIVAHKTGFNSWNEVVNAMKKGPVKMACGTYGRLNHSAAIIVNERMMTNFKLINFPGSAESSNALIRGDVQVGMVDHDSPVGLIEAKEIRPLLIFANENIYPGTVTAKELGFPELADELESQNFIVGSPKIGEERKNILVGAIKKVYADKKFLSIAKNRNFYLTGVYGPDAEKRYLKVRDFHNKIRPILEKYLK